MPTRSEVPHSAAEAAHQLARQGAHVHLVSEGHSTCLKGCCGPEPLTLPDTVRERARLTRLTLAIEAQRR